MSSAFSRAHQSMSASRPWLRRFQALRLAARPSRASANVPASRIAAVAESVRRRRASRRSARRIRVVERELAEHACAEHGDVFPVCARGGRDRVEVEKRADVDVVEALGGRDEQPRAVRRREDQRLHLRLGRDLARRVAEVEPRDRLEPSLAGELRGALALRKLARLVDLGAAEHARVAGRERLRHRRRGAQDVHDDPDRRRRLFVRSEGDVDEHAARLVAMSTAATGMPTCYRHPDRETGLSCSECGRPICTECMTPAAVGIRCPEHAGTAQSHSSLRASSGAHLARARDAPVTKTLVAAQHRRLPDHRRAGNGHQLAGRLARTTSGFSTGRSRTR